MQRSLDVFEQRLLSSDLRVFVLRGAAFESHACAVELLDDLAIDPAAISRTSNRHRAHPLCHRPRLSIGQTFATARAHDSRRAWQVPQCQPSRSAMQLYDQISGIDGIAAGSEQLCGCETVVQT